MSATRAFIVQLYGKFSLTLTVGQYKRKLVEQFLRILQSMGFCSVHVRLRMQCHTNFLPYVRKWGCRVSYNERWVENEAYQQITFLAVQNVDKELVVLEQGSCDKLRTGGGVKRRRIARRSCTWKIFILHGPSPTADIHILTKHITDIKTSHEWQKCTDKYDPLDGNLYSISWRESPDTSTVCNNEDKRNHPHHLFSHCVS